MNIYIKEKLFETDDCENYKLIAPLDLFVIFITNYTL